MTRDLEWIVRGVLIYHSLPNGPLLLALNRFNKYIHTVDGSNPAPVDMDNIPCFIGFRISGGAGFLPSTVVPEK